MSTASKYPYDTRLNILHQHLEVIDEKGVADAAPQQWYNQTLCQVNNSVVRLGVIEGEYHWHKHDHDDEFFYVGGGKMVSDTPHHSTRRPYPPTKISAHEIASR